MRACLTRQEGLWIKYQLARQGYSVSNVAEKIGCHIVSVSQFLNGRNRSEGVEVALVEILGFKDFSTLWEAARRGVAA